MGNSQVHPREIRRGVTEIVTEIDGQQDSPPVIPPPPPPVPSRAILHPGLVTPLIPTQVGFTPATPSFNLPISERTENNRTEIRIDERREERRQNEWEESRKERESKLVQVIRENLGDRFSLSDNEISELERRIEILQYDAVKKIEYMEEKMKINQHFETSTWEYFKGNRSVLYSKRLHKFCTERKSNLVLSHRNIDEVASRVNVLPEGTCTTCYVLHLGVNEGTPCKEYLSAGGPRVQTLLAKTDGWKKQMLAVLIGYQEWMYLPGVFSTEILNLSQTTVGTYNVSTHPDVQLDTRPGSLYSQVNTVLTFLQQVKTTYILVEYMDSPRENGAPMDHILGFLRVIEYLQKGTWHMLVVVTSPALALEGETEATYVEKVWIRQSRNTLLELLCRAKSVPCINVPLQHGTVEGAPEHTTRNPSWGFEPLSTPSGNITREFLRRMHLELNPILDHLKMFPLLIPTHEGYDPQEY